MQPFKLLFGCKSRHYFRYVQVNEQKSEYQEIRKFMEIPITTLQQMLTNAATLGAMSAVKKLDPVKDDLKASEVRAWLGNDSKMSRKFDAMVRKGMIKGFKKGTSQNSPYYYSKCQIEAAFAAVRCKELI